MRTQATSILLLLLSVGAQAADDALPSPLPDDWTCLVTVKGNAVGYPDEPEDGLLILGAFVATSSACQEGDVYLAVYPEASCFVRPKQDPRRDEPMQFDYEPRVVKIRLKPGNHKAETLEIKTSHHGACRFNTHIASCGTVVPPGAKCAVRNLGDPQTPETHGVEREFNRLRIR